MKIEVFGTGCAKCKSTKELINDAIQEHGLSAVVVEVNSIEDIVSRGVLLTPAVAVDGEVKIAGRVPSKEEVKKILGL